MNFKAIGIIIAILVLAVAITVFVQPQPKLGDIENPDYIDPKVLEGTALPEPVPEIAGQNLSGENCESNPNIESKDSCYVVQADNTGNVESCKKISTIAGRNICVEYLAVELAKPELCSYSESAFNPNDNSNVKNACISAVAKEQADETICEKIFNAEWKQKCIEIALDAGMGLQTE